MAVREEESNPSDQNVQQTIERENIEQMLGIQDLPTFVQETYSSSHALNHPVTSRLLVQIDRSFRGRHRRRWKFSNCFRCTSAAGDEDIPSSRDAPPTYSSIYTGPTLYDRTFSIFSINDQTAVVARIPPPTYAQTQGIDLTSSMEPLISVSPNSTNRTIPWPKVPTTAICSRCAAFIITTIVIRRSMITHFTAIMLFLLGCWPCCMIPYCIDSCNYIDHYCPICRAYLGTYTPW